MCVSVCVNWVRIGLFSRLNSVFFSLSPSFFPTSPLDKLTGDPPELVRDNPASVPVMECWEAMEEESKMARRERL